MKEYGNLIIVLGILLILAGILMKYTNILQHFGRLPGDIYIKKENFTFMFPITSMIIVSVILTIIAKFIKK